MHPILFKSLILLAQTQATPWDDAPTAPPPPPKPSKPMSFSDLQQGFRQYQTGETNDTSFRNGILILMACVALLALFIHLRQRKKNGGPPDSLARLGFELGRLVRFPFGSRMMLYWVARTSKVPFASLLLSSVLFDKSIAAWASTPTFAVARQWGKSRLARLRPLLFESA
jgi:hypothetical protein